MRSKVEIVHELLSKHAITEEDAVILLKENSVIIKEKEYVMVQPQPYTPFPMWRDSTGDPYAPPFTVTCKNNIN